MQILAGYQPGCGLRLARGLSDHNAAHCLRAGRPLSNVYYWDSLEALQLLMQHPAHREAKQAQARWLKGYQVVIAQVVNSYGDGGIAHPLAAQRAG